MANNLNANVAFVPQSEGQQAQQPSSLHQPPIITKALITSVEPFSSFPPNTNTNATPIVGNSFDSDGNTNNDSSGNVNTTMNNLGFNGLSGQGQSANQQQLLELVAALNGGNGAANLLQQQQTQTSMSSQSQQGNNNSNSAQQQNQNFQAQLALFQQQQQQQQQQNDLMRGGGGGHQRQHSLSLSNLDGSAAAVQQQNGRQQQQQRNHSLSLSQFDPSMQQQQQAQQQQQQQMPRLGANSSANALMALQRNTSNSNAQTSAPAPSAGAAANAASKQHKQFLLFIKVLLKLLDATQNTTLKDRAKAIVAECTRRNRMGDPAYMPLRDAVEQRLRGVVGEEYWTRAQSYAQSYHTKQPQLLQRAQQRRQQQHLLLARQQQMLQGRSLGVGMHGATRITRL